MSADSHTVCPACHPDLANYNGPSQYPLVSRGVIDHAAEELGYDRSVRENIDYYLHAEDGKLKLAFGYRADCWDCGWHFDTVLETPIPGSELNENLSSGSPSSSELKLLADNECGQGVHTPLPCDTAKLIYPESEL